MGSNAASASEIWRSFQQNPQPCILDLCLFWTCICGFDEEEKKFAFAAPVMGRRSCLIVNITSWNRL